MKRVLLAMVVALLLSFSLNATDVDFGGLIYIYDFMWQNADFDSDTTDGDMHYYMHADVHAKADFGEGVSAFIKIGNWGNFGMDPIMLIAAPGCDEGYGVEIMAAYLKAANLFESPIGITVGKQHMLYGDIAFDGGEDGYTGVKLDITTEMFMVDLFSYRAIEVGGMGFMGTGAGNPGPDTDLHGAWATIKLMEGNVELNGFGFARKNGDDMPMWVGARSAGSPIEGLSYVGDFAMMMGSDAADVDYSGMYYSARANYTFEPVTFGGGYYYFSGDDAGTTENEAYNSPTYGPYPNGFYKGWPGFGTAYTLRSAYGFNLVTPNINVINANLAYNHEMVNLRGDFYMYGLNEVAAGADDDLGMEIALHAIFHLTEQFGFGATGGYWMPGEAFVGEDAMMAGYLYLAKGF